MFRSLGGKLTASVVAISVVIIMAISYFNFQKTSSKVVELYQGIQQQTLAAAYKSIYITMADEAQEHLRIVARDVAKTDRNDVVSQRLILSTTSSLAKYPLMFIVYEDDGKAILQDYSENGNAHLSPAWDSTGGVYLRTRPWYVQTKQKNAAVSSRLCIKVPLASIKDTTLPLRQCLSSKMASLSGSWALIYQ